MEAGDAANQAHFHAWLCTALAQVRLEDDVYVGYVESILQEDSYSSLDEKKEAVLEFLASSTVRQYAFEPGSHTACVVDDRT